jgi:hypothetical protein
MNIVLRKKQFSIENIHFLDMKRNIIVVGDFTKIVYFHPHFSMNGLYFDFPIDVVHNMYPKFVSFSTTSVKNAPLIQELIEIEKEIIESYKQENVIHKRAKYTLQTQLQMGKLKMYRNTFLQNPLNHVGLSNQSPLNTVGLSNQSPLNTVGLSNQSPLNQVGLSNQSPLNHVGLSNQSPLNQVGQKPSIVCKISGIWETEWEFGITFKFIESIPLSI